MSAGNGHPQPPDPELPEYLAEAASLHPQDPERVALDAQLSGSNRETLRQEWALTDRLRESLADVAVPGSLEARLRHIPEASESAGADSVKRDVLATLPQKRNAMKADWRHIAAVLVLAAMAIGLYYYLRPATDRVHLKPSVAQSVARAALQSYRDQADRPHEIVTTDIDEARRFLIARAEATGLDVPVFILRPDQINGDVTLRAAGTCDIGGTKGIYTQWERGNVKYTLYEFNGKHLGVAPIFHPETLSGNAVGAAASEQVFVFPGRAGRCCWALVMEGEQPENVFVRYGYDEYGT